MGRKAEEEDHSGGWGIVADVDELSGTGRVRHSYTESTMKSSITDRIDNHSRSKALQERAERYFPGGVNSPVRAFRAVGGAPPFVARAVGRVGDGR